MKFNFKTLFAAFAMAMVTFTGFAQKPDELPADPQVRHGVLPNGLNYYIRHNETPKGQADFFIAQKVGSILENDDQRGLAHFLEHMCFNGTKNFPGNQLITWLESVSVKFGQNLNAYTGTDETVYNISAVPTARVGVQDSCLLILHDWADDLLLDGEEIDKERGVIHEEWRASNVGRMRILEQILPTMYPESKYGYRLPIGTMEVVDNFPHQALRDYYEAWYRPDQQGIIVVGDIDVDRIEGKIKELFGPIEMPADAKPREIEEVPDTEGTIYAIGADKEMQFPMFNIFFKNEVMPKEMRNTMIYMVSDYIFDMISSMLNNRYAELAKDPSTSFAVGMADYSNYLLANSEDALSLTGVAKGDDMIPAFKSVYRELLRALRGGFTITEYDRARSQYLSDLENAYNNREKHDNTAYAREIVRHFIDGTPMPGIEYEYNTMSLMANNVPVDAINQTLKQLITNDNRVVMAMLPEKEGVKVPTAEELAAAMAEVDAENIEAFVDEVKAEPLIPQLPAPGKIVSETPVEKWGATKLTLSNGVEVVVKPTQFKADEILFDAQALGGTSVLPDSYASTLVLFPYAADAVMSLGDYTNKDLQKFLQGKQVSVDLQFGNYLRDVAGSTTPKDLKTAMEMLYMTFTNFNVVPSEFEGVQKQFEGVLKNQVNTPEYIFQSRLLESLYENPRSRALSIEAINGATADQFKDVVRKMTANAADYTFFFVGNIDMDTFRPLVEQYIATLPADAAAKTVKPEILPSLLVKAGEKQTVSSAKMQTPQTYAAVIEYGNIDYTPKTRALANVAGQILSKRFLDKVREEMGATYSIWASGSLDRVDDGQNFTIQSTFPMKPEMQQQVLDYIVQEFKNMESNVTPEELAKVVEFSVKNIEEAKEKNGGWLNGMAGEAQNGVDTFNGAADTYKAITPADVQDFMKAANAQGNYRVVLLEPAAE